MESADWFEDRQELLAVAQMLIVEADVFTTPADVYYFLEKPWKWSEDRELWVRAGRPGLGDPGWEMFMNRLQVRISP